MIAALLFVVGCAATIEDSTFAQTTRLLHLEEDTNLITLESDGRPDTDTNIRKGQATNSVESTEGSQGASQNTQGGRGRHGGSGLFKKNESWLFSLVKSAFPASKAAAAEEVAEKHFEQTPNAAVGFTCSRSTGKTQSLGRCGYSSEE